MKNKTEAVIFDLDGTLLDTLIDLRNAVNFALSKQGYTKRSLEEIRRFVGDGMPQLIFKSLYYDVIERRTVMREHAFEDNELVLKTLSDFLDYYRIHSKENTRAYEGVIPMLRECKKRGIKTAIVSNKAMESVRALSKEYFSGLIDISNGAGGEFPYKPEPDIVEDVLSKLGVKKTAALYVGDSQVDIETAKNAGIKMIAALWGFRDKRELEVAGARYFISNPGELFLYL